MSREHKEVKSVEGETRRLSERCLDPDCSIFPTFVSCEWPPEEIAHMSGREDRSSFNVQIMWPALYCTSGPTQNMLTENYSSSEIEEKWICHTCLQCAVTDVLSFSFSKLFFGPILAFRGLWREE